ncbi:ER membrane protein complex subunit 4 isoform X2 [Phyllostomus hastatus]|uniref:ER membrane protein complex subunit 4 isoform X2 n=1 Tax=Phyllostomus hastatus TaxID=9423 RepID=UPI001E682260|nr:ER membrane protein complex subunit 4 isoform X2 [Phyllostomus hastatus]
MTAQGSLVANRGRRFKWAIELSAPGGGSRGRSDRGGGQGDSLYPVGYLDKQVPDTSVQETDRILVEKRCWDIALGPLKQIPMNLFIMYMAGNTISIFPTMMVCMMAWRPIQALMAISAKDGVQWRRIAFVNLRTKHLLPMYLDRIYNLLYAQWLLLSISTLNMIAHAEKNQKHYFLHGGETP